MKNCIVLFILSISLFACKKKTSCDAVTTKAPDAEFTALKTQIDLLGVSYDTDSRGFCYKIITAGGAEKPDVCKNVTITYDGEFFNGNTFDSGTSNFLLDKLIIGWKEGLPLIGKGGKIILYLPPSLAYGASGSGAIPPNSNLIFTIDLIDFK